MDERAQGGDLSTILRSPLREIADEALLVTGDPDLVAHAVTALSDLGAAAPDTVRLLAPERTLDEVTARFFAASKAADLSADRLDLRVTAEPSVPSLLVTADGLAAIVRLPGGAAVRVGTADEDVVLSARSAYLDAIRSAREYAVSVPPYATLLEELGDRVGDGTRVDLEQIVEAGVEVRSDRDGLDEAELSLLLGSRNEAMFTDLSRWAEDAGVASRATMSARKRELEAAGLVATESVKHGVGRPKHQLFLADDLAGLGPTDVVRAAQSVLAG